MGEQDITLAVLQEQVVSLKERLSALETDVQAKFTRIENKLDEAIKGRPSWSITFVLGGLTTVCASLIVFALMK